MADTTPVLPKLYMPNRLIPAGGYTDADLQQVLSAVQQWADRLYVECCGGGGTWSVGLTVNNGT